MSSNTRNLTLLLTCQGITTLGLMVLVPIMPLYVATLAHVDAETSARWSSLALAAPALGILFLAPYVGQWCDRFGYRRMLMASLAVFVASMLLMAFSPSIHGFLLGRLLQGMSTLGVVLTAFIGHAGGETSRGRALGLQESAIACGALIGPVLGGVMHDYWSIQPLLTASAIVTGVVGLVLWGQLREPPRSVPQSIAPFAGFRTVWGHSDLRNWMLAICLAQAAAFALVNIFALYMMARFPETPAIASKTGLLHALGWLATMLASPVWGHLNDRSDPRRHFMLAGIGCALSTGLLAVIDHIWLVGLLRVIQGACYAALTQSMLLACIRQVPAPAHGHITGIGRSFMVVGQLVGPILVMLLIPITGPLHLLWLVAVLFMIAGLLAQTGGGLPFTELNPGKDAHVSKPA